MKAKNVFRLIFSIIICQLAGLIGAIFTSPSIPGWYAGLQKPSFSPPNWLFAPVWTLLFLLMGISMYLIWSKGLKNSKVKVAMSVFGVQLALNTFWSIIFFGLQNPFYAFIEIMVLWLAILLTIYQFWKIERKAAYLLIPYILWVTFAAMLNLYIWQLNL